MTWNKAKPASSDLISDSQSDITANWTAIEEGSGAFFQDKVVLKEAAGDPTEQADRAMVYGKEIGSQTELFARNDASGDAVVQMTDSGNLGSTSTPILFNSLSHDGTRTFAENNFIAAWGLISYNAGSETVTLGTGLTSVTSTNGVFTITLDAGRVNNENYGVMATHLGSGVAFVTSFTRTTSTFKVTTAAIGTGSAKNGDFFVFVVGGQT